MSLAHVQIPPRCRPPCPNQTSVLLATIKALPRPSTARPATTVRIKISMQSKRNSLTEQRARRRTAKKRVTNSLSRRNLLFLPPLTLLTAPPPVASPPCPKVSRAVKASTKTPPLTTTERSAACVSRNSSTPSRRKSNLRPPKTRVKVSRRTVNDRHRPRSLSLCR